MENVRIALIMKGHRGREDNADLTHATLVRNCYRTVLVKIVMIMKEHNKVDWNVDQILVV